MRGLVIRSYSKSSHPVSGNLAAVAALAALLSIGAAARAGNLDRDTAARGPGMQAMSVQVTEARETAASATPARLATIDLTIGPIAERPGWLPRRGQNAGLAVADNERRDQWVRPELGREDIETLVAAIDKPLVVEGAKLLLPVSVMSDGSQFNYLQVDGSIAGELDLAPGVGLNYAATGSITLTADAGAVHPGNLAGGNLSLRLGHKSEGLKIQPEVGAMLDLASGEVLYQFGLGLSL